MPGFAGGHQKQESVLEQVLPQSVEGTNPARTFISDCWPPELWEDKFLSPEVTMFVAICYGSHGKHTVSLVTIWPLTDSTDWLPSFSAVLEMIVKYNTETVTGTNPSGHFPYFGVIQATFIWEISPISHSMANVDGEIHLVTGVLWSS